MSLVSFSEQFYKIKVPTGTVTSPYGSIDSWHRTPHTGCDFSAPIGTPLYAPLDGIVSKVHDYGMNTGLGKAIFVRLSDGRQYAMGHLSEFKVSVGQVVHKGDLLALSGNTGRSSGPHVHFACYDKEGHFIDPDVFFESVNSNLTMWAEKVLVLNNESHTAFMNDPDIVSFMEPTSLLFKLYYIVIEVI